MTKILFIGDPHFKTDNIPDVEKLIERLEQLVIETTPDLICIGGDLLHEHERLHTIPLNKAYDFIDRMRKLVYTVVLVGNHDYQSNQQFLTENHWMNALKEWDNVKIVDKVFHKKIDDELFVFCPYVPPQRFEEALNTTDGWINASIIFCHQEFYGCKMGAIISIEGDKWPLQNPHIVSGHIHSKQRPQENIYYTGSSMQHAFGESDKNIVALLTIKGKTYETEEIDLALPRKKIVYMNVSDLDTYENPVTEDKIKITLKGNQEEFKTIKKTKKYKELIDKGVKIVFKPSKKVSVEKTDKDIEKADFIKILDHLIHKEKNTHLTEAYELLINNKIIESDDILYI